MPFPKTFLPAIAVCLGLGTAAHAVELGKSTKALLLNSSGRTLKITILGAVPLPAPGSDPGNVPPFVPPSFDFTVTLYDSGGPAPVAQWDPLGGGSAWVMGGKSFTVPARSAVSFESTSLDIHPLVQRLQMAIEDGAHPGVNQGTLFYGVYRFEVGAMLTQVKWGGVWATSLPPALGLQGRRPRDTFDAEIMDPGAAPAPGATEGKGIAPGSAPAGCLLPEPPDGQWDELRKLDPALVRQLRQDLAALFKEMDGPSSSSSSSAPAAAGLLPEPVRH